MNNICDNFLFNPSIDPTTKSPLTKEQLIEFRKSCGFNKEPHKEPQITSISSKDIFNDENIKGDNILTLQPSNSIENIKWWMYSQKRYFDSLKESDLTIIKFYESLNMYDWNSVLRGQKEACDNKTKSPTELTNEFLWFYELITKSPKTPHMYLFRGENIDTFDTFNLPYSKDGNIKKEGFISTSLSLHQAYMFSAIKWINEKPVASGTDKNRNIYMIEIPAGTPALFLGSKNYPIFDSRYEIVLPPCIWRYIRTTDIKVGNTILNVKVVKLEVILPFDNIIKGFNSPTVDKVIYDFIIRLINIKQDDFTWVIEGSYGFNIMLYNRYKLQNLKSVSSINISCYYNSNLRPSHSYKIYEDIGNDIKEKYGLSKDRIKSKINAEEDEIHSYIINYSVCPDRKNEIIKLKYINKPFDEGLIDKELTYKVKLPIKTKEGYMREIEHIINSSINNEEINSDFIFKPKDELEKMYKFLKTLS